jgi:hypothetical protein
LPPVAEIGKLDFVFNGLGAPDNIVKAPVKRVFTVICRERIPLTVNEFLERRFPESRRKAYYLMSIHEHLPPQARKQLKEVGWTKGLELAKLARRDGQHFDCATWLHKAR